MHMYKVQESSMQKTQAWNHFIWLSPVTHLHISLQVPLLACVLESSIIKEKMLSDLCAQYPVCRKMSGFLFRHDHVGQVQWLGLSHAWTACVLTVLSGLYASLLGGHKNKWGFEPSHGQNKCAQVFWILFIIVLSNDLILTCAYSFLSTGEEDIHPAEQRGADKKGPA